MRLEHLDHAIRAAHGITGLNVFYVLGTAALLPQHPELADVVVKTQEVDIWPENADDKAEALESIGEVSSFHRSFGFYVDPYNPELAVFPTGWKTRCVQYSHSGTQGAVALCAEKHDLVVAKLARGEPKDHEFVIALIQRQIVDPKLLKERIAMVAPTTFRYQQNGESSLRDIRSRILANFNACLEKTIPPKEPPARGADQHPDLTR